MSNEETIDISVRGVPAALYERIKRAARRELRGRGISINVMTILLLEEAMDARERNDAPKEGIEESIEALEPVNA